MRRVAGVALSWFASVSLAPAQSPAGPEFLVNTYTTNAQSVPSVAMHRSGSFVVVWQSYGQDGSLGGIFGQRYDIDGTAAGPEFPVNGGITLGHQFSPHVTMDRSGGFLVTWGNPEIYVRRYSRFGAPVGGEIQANVNTAMLKGVPAVAADAGGNFVVVWQHSGRDGDGESIFGRRFYANGTPRGPDFQVNSAWTGNQRRPDVAMLSDGGFVVVFEGPGNPADAVHARRFSPSGVPLGAEFPVRVTSAAQFSPSVAALRPDGFVVAWMEYGSDGSDNGISATAFNADATVRFAEQAVNTFTTNAQRYPSVAGDGAGGFVVSWESVLQDGSSTGVNGQRFNATGTRRGAEFAVNTYTTGAQGYPAVAADGAGNFVIAWSSAGQDGSDRAVMARRFQGLVPVAIAVDTAGNGVLEVSELVDVVPSWRNTTTATQAFQGGMFSFTGPTPASYSVADATADYGSVPAGASRSCEINGDCYAVIVAAPVRPAVHWDATVQEALSGAAAAQGLQKQWTLHLGDSFPDVPRANPFYRFVETLLHHGVTGGCTGTTYCPAGGTTREQMAVFVLVANEGSGYAPAVCGATPMFGDVTASSPFCRWIEELARRGVVSGCGGGNYCPWSPVSREQMAVFVLRTLDPTLAPPACTTPAFSDVPASSPFCAWIEELARRAVVTGCGGGNYCPFADVTREQMGVFISVTFALSLYGP